MYSPLVFRWGPNVIVIGGENVAGNACSALDTDGRG